MSSKKLSADAIKVIKRNANNLDGTILFTDHHDEDLAAIEFVNSADLGKKIKDLCFRLSNKSARSLADQAVLVDAIYGEPEQEWFDWATTRKTELVKNAYKSYFLNQGPLVITDEDIKSATREHLLEVTRLAACKGDNETAKTMLQKAGVKHNWFSPDSKPLAAALFYAHEDTAILFVEHGYLPNPDDMETALKFGLRRFVNTCLKQGLVNNLDRLRNDAVEWNYNWLSDLVKCMDDNELEDFILKRVTSLDRVNTLDFLLYSDRFDTGFGGNPILYRVWDRIVEIAEDPRGISRGKTAYNGCIFFFSAMGAEIESLPKIEKLLKWAQSHIDDLEGYSEVLDDVNFARVSNWQCLESEAGELLQRALNTNEKSGSPCGATRKISHLEEIGAVVRAPMDEEDSVLDQLLPPALEESLSVEGQ